MKELLKKASLTVATACLVAGGLVSVGWAGSGESDFRGPQVLAAPGNSAEKIEKQEPMPDDLEINGHKYKRVRVIHQDLLAPCMGGVGPHCPF